MVYMGEMSSSPTLTFPLPRLCTHETSQPSSFHSAARVRAMERGMPWPFRIPTSGASTAARTSRDTSAACSAQSLWTFQTGSPWCSPPSLSSLRSMTPTTPSSSTPHNPAVSSSNSCATLNPSWLPTISPSRGGTMTLRASLPSTPRSAEICRPFGVPSSCTAKGWSAVYILMPGLRGANFGCCSAGRTSALFGVRAGERGRRNARGRSLVDTTHCRFGVAAIADAASWVSRGARCRGIGGGDGSNMEDRRGAYAVLAALMVVEEVNNNFSTLLSLSDQLT